MSARVVELDGDAGVAGRAGGGDPYGGGRRGGGQRRTRAPSADDAGIATAFSSSAPARHPQVPTIWEAGPLSASYDWTRFPNRLKAIKRVLALPLLDITAYAWLDPRRFLQEARKGAASSPFPARRPPPPRMFAASDDSYDSSSGGDGDDGEGGGGDGGGGGDYDLRARRRQQQQRLAAPLPRRARRQEGAPSHPLPSAAAAGARPPWCGCGIVCRDRVLGGLVTVDPAARTLDYTKSLPAPFPLGGAALALGASWRLDGQASVPGQPAWRPALRVGLTTALRGGGGGKGPAGGEGGGGAAADATRASATIRGSPLGSIDVRQTAFLDRRLGLEFVGDVSARLRPAAARRATAGAAALLERGGGGLGAPAGSATTIPLSPDLFDSVVVHADVSEVNLVWRL